MSNILGSHGFFESWKNRNIILITKNPEILPDEITSRIERRSWKISLITSDVKKAFNSIAELKASMLIFDSSPDLPASVLLRAQLNDPLAFTTPTWFFVMSILRKKTILKKLVYRSSLINP